MGLPSNKEKEGQLYDVYEFGRFLMCGTADEVYGEIGRTVPTLMSAGRNRWCSVSYLPMRYEAERSSGPARRGEGFPFYWECREKLPDVPDSKLTQFVSQLAYRGIDSVGALAEVTDEEMRSWARFGEYSQRLARRMASRTRFSEGDVVTVGGRCRVVSATDGDRVSFADGGGARDGECEPLKVKACPLCGDAVRTSASSVLVGSSQSEQHRVSAECECGLSFAGRWADTEEDAWDAFAEGWNVSRRSRKGW